MADLPEHPFDSVAQEIANWINTESSWYANALTEGYRAPFSAKVSESDKLAYYRRQMYQQNPDGTPDYTKPNPEGRAALYKRVGAQQYADIALAVSPGKGIEHIQKLSLDIPGQEENTDGSDY